MNRILIIGQDCGRWGPARLPEHLHQSGFAVATLCSIDNPLAHSSFVEQRYELAEFRSARRFARQLCAVLNDWRPTLIIPCDEPVVVMLHYLVRNRKLFEGLLDGAQIDVLHRSLGRAEMWDCMVFKNRTRTLAERLGVRAPKAREVRSTSEAVAVAGQIGFPVFVKKSFSWAGEGSIRCTDENQVVETFNKLNRKTRSYKQLVRRMLSKDWFPVNSAIEVMEEIKGESSMYAVAAWNGHVVAGLFGRRLATIAATGPSTSVAIGDHEECRQAVRKMVSAMGGSGFLAFDFMICSSTGRAYLLECNPRPNQICHLGRQLGADLCSALASAMNGDQQAQLYPRNSRAFQLFPQEWLHNDQAALACTQAWDVPIGDKRLMEFMLEAGRKRGRSINALKDALPAGLEQCA